MRNFQLRLKRIKDIANWNSHGQENSALLIFVSEIFFITSTIYHLFKTLDKSNAPGMTRTCGTWIRNPLLYPPELRGQGV